MQMEVVYLTNQVFLSVRKGQTSAKQKKKRNYKKIDGRFI